MCKSAFHAHLEHGDAHELTELGGVRLVVEGAGDEHVEAGIARLTEACTRSGRVAVSVKSQRRWIIEAPMHSNREDFRDGEIAAHPEIVDLEPNAATRSVALIGQREVFGPAACVGE